MVYQKKIVEEVSGWLRIFDDGWVDRTWTGPPEVKFMAEPVLPHEEFIDGVAIRDVTIDENSGLSVRIYLPQHEPDHYTDNSDKLPLIVHFHGGGFCISQADWYMYYYIYSRLARSAPAIVVSVYLRLAPEHRLPAAIDDGFSALMWLRALAQGQKSYESWLNNHGDFNRVFLIGDSSGGNLVHHVAARAGQLDLSPMRLAGGIPVHPGFVRSERSKSEMEQPESPFLTLDMVDRFLKLALPKGCTKDHPFTCPMGQAAPPLDSLNLPPFLLCVAEADLIRDTEMEYYEAMKKANKDVELLINPGVGHSFYLNKIAVDMDPHTAAQTTGLLEGIVEFIKKH
ncbi:PREDICTED: probable carboxylesterase 15 [Populus euphratica]|uniref:Probable carboxylesterase 15 n=1 Tax=Populus euphratica TaxID=75702 RepID=A0AAJ6XXH7_POPEU|nr:PREDICTED: probable carboxylesterase 15 [Populus euphratica]